MVDNASTDGSVAMVRAEFPGVMLIEPGENHGFAAGTNLGLQWLCDLPLAQRPAYLLLLNPDTIVHPAAIETLAAFLDAHPRVGAVGPRLLNSDGSLQPAAFRFPTLSMTVLDLFPPGEVLPGRLYGSWWHGRYPQEQGDEPFPIDHPLGACILTRTDVIETLGMLDSGFHMYVEEVEWCLRIRRAGWSIWQVPQARVTHIGGAATSQFRARMLVALWRSRMRFVRMAQPPHIAAVHRLVLQAGMLRAAGCAWLDYARRRIDRSELRARLWAYGEAVRP
ncbi:MAG TPA: glycosyltransferase family 2 protein [Roseiflexaceae bacterium]|nr:glycosyltransferase family 2 protein [Roseiflexaceae bacterium]